MGKPFAVGDQVEWRYMGGERWTGGIIGLIDQSACYMVVYQGHLYGLEPSRVGTVVRRIDGRWLAFRTGGTDYLDRIRHVKK